MSPSRRRATARCAAWPSRDIRVPRGRAHSLCAVAIGRDGRPPGLPARAAAPHRTRWLTAAPYRHYTRVVRTRPQKIFVLLYIPLKSSLCPFVLKISLPTAITYAWCALPLHPRNSHGHGARATTRALSPPSRLLSSLSGEKEWIVNYQLTFRNTTKMSPIICYISVNRPLF